MGDDDGGRTMTDTDEILELGFAERTRQPAGYWSVRVTGERAEVGYTPSPSDPRPDQPLSVVTTLRELLEHPPERLQRDGEACAEIYRALVSRGGAATHSFRSTASIHGVPSRLHAVVARDRLNWTEERDSGALAAGSVAVADLGSFRPEPPASFHVHLWIRLAHLAQTLSLPPKLAWPADEAASRRSPPFSSSYLLGGRKHRTELYATPRVAVFEVGPDERTARSHEGTGFEVPLLDLLAAGAPADPLGEPPKVIESLTVQLREWIDARVDPYWKLDIPRPAPPPRAAPPPLTQTDLLAAIKQSPEDDALRRSYAQLLVAAGHPRGSWMQAQLDAADPNLPTDARARAAERAAAEFEAALAGSDERARRDLSRDRPSVWTRIQLPDQLLGECAMRLVVDDLDPSGQLTSVYTLRYQRGMLAGVHIERGFANDVSRVSSVLMRGPIRGFGAAGPLLGAYVRVGGLRDVHYLLAHGAVDADLLARVRRAAQGLRRVDLSRASLVGARSDVETALHGLEVVWPAPGLAPSVTQRFERFEAFMAEVLAEEDRQEAYDASWSPCPYAPDEVAAGLAVPEALPYLISTLESAPLRERRWARYALQRLGPAAAAAADTLERHGHTEALFHVDEARARALGVHRQLGVRHTVVRVIAGRGPEATRQHFEALLADRDPDVLCFALGSGVYPDHSGLTTLGREAPQLVPVAQVRAHLDAADVHVRSAAINVLATLHLPEDAERVLELLIAQSGSVRCRAASWLGSLPRSDAWIPFVEDLDEVAEVVRRRRCAGLRTSSERVRERVLAALQAGAGSPGQDAARKRAIGFAADIVYELRDARFASALVDAIGPVEGAPPRSGEGPFQPLVAALGSLAEAGTAAVAAATYDAPARRERLSWMRDALEKWRPAAPLLATGDAHFTAGELVDTLGGGALGAYAGHLYAHPRAAHAAFQIAWIERGLGVFISPQRVGWLRDLGIAEPLLAELSQRPPAILFGYSFGHPRKLEPRDMRILADTAMQAGLLGTAASYYREGWPDEAARARDAARAHVERVRAACGAGPAPSGP